MSDTPKTNRSNEERGLITHANPANPAFPLLDSLGDPVKPPQKPKPKRTTRNRTKKG